MRRRTFLTGAGAAFAAFVTGCGDDDTGDESAPTTGGGPGTTGADGTTTTATTPPAVELASNPFTLGVASGEPRADSVVLWTRLALDPLAVDGLGGMPDEPVEVMWELSPSEGLTNTITYSTVTAGPEHAHAVHVTVEDLEPATDYYYRFRVGDHESPIGRTRTLPDGSPTSFAIAVANCQWKETGAWGAYRNLAQDDVDLVLHLGDYIYEYAGVEGPRMAQPAHELQTLEDYRLRYASYRSDPDLQAAHARFPFVITWDDHEVHNNHNGETPDDRRAAAYKAWWEHQPTRLDPPTGPELAVHQSFAVGDLVRITVLDERQYSDVPPCRDIGDDDYGDCAARAGEDRSMLGDIQESFVVEAVDQANTTWHLFGNPVVLAGVNGGNATDGAAYYLDTWDGFPSARHRFIDTIARASNPVVLTGDYHAGMVLDVHQRPFEESPVVAPEFMSPAISSPLFPADVSAGTPHLRQQLNAHGYLRVVVGADHLTAEFKILDDVQDPGSAITTASTWEVAAGDPVARQVT